MRKILFLLPAILLFVGGTTIAQNSYKINYTIDLEEAGEMDDMAKSMMQDMTMTLAFDGTKSRIDMDMSMMKMSTRINMDQKKGVVLMEMMGMKTATLSDPESFDEQNAPEFDVRETGKTKTIAGYKCSQAFIQDKDTGIEQEIWYTPKIKIDAAGTEYMYEGLEGFPLEMIVDEDGMKMRMTATSVSDKSLGSDYFSTEIPEGYTLQDEPLMGE